MRPDPTTRDGRAIGATKIGDGPPIWRDKSGEVADDPSEGLGKAIWADALCAAACLAVDPFGLGGMVVRAQAGPVRDRFVDVFKRVAVADRPLRKLPPHCPEDRLIGGLDLSATLQSGRPVMQRGVLSEAHGGFVVLPMAERADTSVISTLGSALDRGELELQRDGLSTKISSQISVLALDEGSEAEESIAHALSDRLAFQCDLSPLSIRDWDDTLPPTDELKSAQQNVRSLRASDESVRELAELAALFGVASPRVLLHAVRCAVALSALKHKAGVGSDEIATAARLVIAPRATQLPMVEDDAVEEQEPPDQEPDDAPSEREKNELDQNVDKKLDDEIIDAIEAAIPPDLLARLKIGLAGSPSSVAQSSGEGGEKSSLQRGRPLAARRGKLGGRQRLHLVETLRAAAPWQKLRKRDAVRGKRIHIGSDDIRVRRFKQKDESLTIFVVDASGSSALHRLAEVKGAVELLLAESYARRDHVALISFRESSAELVLPPTRSLVRAKRSLAGLPGGGGTPLALSIDTALQVALDSQRQGRSPRIVFLTDCKANIGYGGRPGRAQAMGDAEAAAVRMASHGFATLLIDTCPRKNPSSQALAEKLGAQHMALPYPSAEGIQAILAAGDARVTSKRPMALDGQGR